MADLEALKRMYSGMGSAARQMGAEDLKGRYGKPGLCAECAADMEGAAVCPECGAEAEVAEEMAEGEAPKAKGGGITIVLGGGED